MTPSTRHSVGSWPADRPAVRSVLTRRPPHVRPAPVRRTPLFSDDVSYVDPEGREALTALIGAVQEQFGAA
ncbi:hypothetical protein [Mycobacterium sp. URHB0021]